MLFKNILLLLTAVGTASALNGDATYFFPALGACGEYNVQSDLVAAISIPQYNAAVGRGPRCGQKIKVNYNGKSVTAVVADKCMGCANGDVDLSPAAFSKLAHTDLGRIKVTWDYV